MGSNARGMRLVERVYVMAVGKGPMTSRELWDEYSQAYLGQHQSGLSGKNSFVQKIRSSRMFRAVHRIDTKTKEIFPPWTADEMKVGKIPNRARMEMMYEAMSMDDIIKPYVTPGMRPFRMLDRMPMIVRQAVQEAGGEQQ